MVERGGYRPTHIGQTKARGPHPNLGPGIQRDAAGEPRLLADQPVHATEILDDGTSILIEPDARVTRLDVGVVEHEVVREAASDGQWTFAERVPGAGAAGVHHLENHRHEMRSR